jgi:amidase
MPDSLNRRQALKTITAASTSGLALTGGVTPLPEISEICSMTAVQMADLIRRQKLSARETMTAHLKQIERLNPKVNSIVTLAADKAMANAAKADEAQAHGAELGPLHGLPIAHKDLVNTAGIRTTFGSPIFKENVPAQDDIVVENCRRAGAICLGKTNTPEFGAGSQTFNKVFGATHNPYDLSKTCGGSSGGAAVSLRCGFVPIADGSDAGGSLRNPAGYSNVVGFRVSPGRVPSLGWQTIAVQGPMGRTVEDVALLLSAIAGYDPRSPISINESGAPFRKSLSRSLHGVRVAWFKDLGGVPFDPVTRQVVNANRKAFESLGCIVEEAEPDFTGTDAAFKTMRCAGYALSEGDNVRLHRDLVKDTIIWEVERGEKLSAVEYERAQVTRAAVWERMRLFMEKYEYFVLPTAQLPPFDVTLPYPTEINGVQMETYIDWMKTCWYISFVENPSISVPAGFTPAGLPVGLQIVGRHRADFSVLQLASAFTAVTKFGERKPEIV